MPGKELELPLAPVLSLASLTILDPHAMEYLHLTVTADTPGLGVKLSDGSSYLLPSLRSVKYLGLQSSESRMGLASKMDTKLAVNSRYVYKWVIIKL